MSGKMVMPVCGETLQHSKKNGVDVLALLSSKKSPTFMGPPQGWRRGIRNYEMPTALIQADLYQQHNKETASAGGHPTQTMAELNIKASEWKQKGQINFQSVDRLQSLKPHSLSTLSDLLINQSKQREMGNFSFSKNVFTTQPRTAILLRTEMNILRT